MADDNKSPQDQFKELIKSGVNAANSGLRTAQKTFENCREPVSATLKTVEQNGAIALESAKKVYAQRKQYAPEIIGGTTALSGGYLLLRRGKIAGAVGAIVGAGTAYSVVYDEFPVYLENIPNLIFGKKDQ